MSGRRVLLAGTMALVLAGAVAACGGDESSQEATETSTTSEEAQAAASPPVGVAAASQSAEEILEYWTPEREASAQPFSVTAPDQTAVNPAATASQPSADSAVDGVSAPGSSGGVQPGRLSGDLDWKIVKKPYTQLPFRSVGVLYFNVGAQKDWTCSATAVGSPNESVVWTAGHCLYWGGKWSSSVKFAPGYYSAPGSSKKEKPYGNWPVRAGLIYVPQGWVDTAKKESGVGVDWSLDVAAIVVGRRQGRTLVDTVGAQGIQWTRAPGRIVDIGYPAQPSPPFRFGPQYLCVSPVVQGRTASDPLAIDCDFGEGASGGPWIEDYQADRGWGYIGSVNSFGQPEDLPDVYFGPRLGKAAENLYNAAKDK